MIDHELTRGKAPSSRSAEVSDATQKPVPRGVERLAGQERVDRTENRGLVLSAQLLEVHPGVSAAQHVHYHIPSQNPESCMFKRHTRTQRLNRAGTPIGQHCWY